MNEGSTQIIICKKYESNLVEERTVCDGEAESVEAHSKHHVIWCIIAVALAATLQKLNHSLPAEHHAAAEH